MRDNQGYLKRSKGIIKYKMKDLNQIFRIIMDKRIDLVHLDLKKI